MKLSNFPKYSDQESDDYFQFYHILEQLDKQSVELFQSMNRRVETLLLMPEYTIKFAMMIREMCLLKKSMIKVYEYDLYQDGYNDGKHDGERDGFDEGIEEGYQNGLEDGKKEMEEQSEEEHSDIIMNLEKDFEDSLETRAALAYDEGYDLGYNRGLQDGSHE